MVHRLVELDQDRLLKPDGALAGHRARHVDLEPSRRRVGRVVDDDGGDEDDAGRGARPGQGRGPEDVFPPGRSASTHAPRAIHQLAPQRRLEGVVEGRIGHTAFAQQVCQSHQLLVLEDVVELGVVLHAHSSGLKLSASSRSRLTPRWMSSLTAPGVLPIATAMSSIFMSSWNLSTSAVFCWTGRASTSAQIRLISSRWAACSSSGGPPLRRAWEASRGGVGGRGGYLLGVGLTENLLD